jgi:hypothetical protein
MTQEQIDFLNKPFNITSICRADLQGMGYEVEKIDDSQMTQIASKMADAYCDDGFWIDAEIITDNIIKN